MPKKLLNKLLNRFSKKDAEAERLIFKMFYQKVYRIAYYIVKDGHYAEDITQETFYKIHKNKDNIQSIENIEAWIGTIHVTI